MASGPPDSNALSAASLSERILASLPKTASPQIKNPYDAIALAAHGSLVAVGFRLIGLNEDHRLDTPSDSSQPRTLPAEWNTNSGNYSFRYAHLQSSMEYLLKLHRMGSKVVVMGMGIGDDRTCSFEIVTQEYVSDGNLPATPLEEDKDESQSKRKLMNVFISDGRLSDFGSLMRINLIQKLMPGMRKEGYEETQEAQSTRREPPPDREPQQPAYDPLREDRNPPARPFPLHDPLAQPRGPLPEPMPGFEDEFETMRPPRGGIPGGGMPGYGDRDLYPQGLGPRDPLRGGVGPGLGPMGGGPRGGGGMHPTFDDPMFGGQGQRGPGGYDPQNPPGSRFDPTGPGIGGHPRGAGMGGRPPNPFGGFGGGDFI